MDRTQEILEAVDTMFAIHDAWEADDEVTLPTRELEMAIVNAVEVCDFGDVPAPCRELVTAMSRLGLEWDKYQNGARTPDHKPVGAFWGAYRAVVQAREVARPPEVKHPEPVHLLLKQKVSETQIAFFIWGWRNPRTSRFEGPFVTAAQQPDMTKIHEEAKEPGKYTKDWVHPEQLERMKERRIDLSRRLSAAERAEAADKPTEEKASVLEMLKEGQYADVIARVKRVSMDDVLRVAKEHGITVNARPNLAGVDTPGPDIFGASSDDLDPLEDDEDLDDDDDDDDDDELLGEPAAVEPQRAVEDLVRELAAAGKTQPDIVAECRQQGHAVTYKQIKAILKPAKASK